eukprot:gene8842-9021_t
MSEPKRVALVVGNSVYSNNPDLRLLGPARDGDALVQQLKAAGFEVVPKGEAVINARKDQLPYVLQAFETCITSDALALFAYSGHGLAESAGQPVMMCSCWDGGSSKADLEGVIGMACLPGGIAIDGGEQGIYTKHLLKHLFEPGKAIMPALSDAAQAVYNETRDQQLPRCEFSCVPDSFYTTECLMR